MNQLFNSTAFQCNTEQSECIQNYQSSVYFVLVNLQTVGYGDIYPIITWSRLAISFMTLTNLIMLSQTLSKLVELIYQLSPYIQTYDFQQHVVIIGYCPDIYLIRFIEELVEFDNIQRMLGHENRNNGINIIIVGQNEPSQDIRYQTQFYDNNSLYDNHVVYLKAEIFQYNIKWYEQANLNQCRALFVFSLKGGQNILQEDIDLAFLTRKIKDYHSDLECFLVLQSQYKEQIQEDSLFKDIKIISSTECNEAIMGFSIEKTGFSVFIQHLLSLKNKNIPKQLYFNLNQDAFQSNYIRNMEQEIYQVFLGEKFAGLTFQQLFQLFYFTGFSLKGRDISCVDQGLKIFKDENLATLIAIKRIDSNKKVNILFNPQDFIIEKGDIGYIICSDYQEVIQCQNITMNCNLYNQCKKNVKKLRLYKQKYIQKEQSTLISEWLSIEKQRHVNEAKQSIQITKNCMKKQLLQRQNTRKQTNIFQQQEKIISKSLKRVFNFKYLEYPQIEFVNHIIIFGNLQQFSRIINLLKSEYERAVILFTEDPFDQYEWIKLRLPHKNIYYIQGEFHNFHHIRHLKIGKSFSVLILSTLTERLFQDSHAITLGRMILEYFDQKNILIELRDDNRIHFFKKNPTFVGINQSITPFLWPAFQQGNIHLSSCLFGLLARCLSDPDWLRFLEQLIQPNNSVDDNYKCNKQISSYRLTEKIARYCNYFGVLQYLLIENTPSVIALAIIKFQMSSEHKNNIYSNIIDKKQERKSLRRQNIQNRIVFPEDSQSEISIKNDPEFLQVASSLFGDRFVFTNPGFFTPIEKDDIILVLGNIDFQVFEKQLSKDINPNDINKKKQKKINQLSQLFINNNESTQDLIQEGKQLDKINEEDIQFNCEIESNINNNKYNNNNNSFSYNDNNNNDNNKGNNNNNIIDNNNDNDIDNNNDNNNNDNNNNNNNNNQIQIQGLKFESDNLRLKQNKELNFLDFSLIDDESSSLIFKDDVQIIIEDKTNSDCLVTISKQQSRRKIQNKLNQIVTLNQISNQKNDKNKQTLDQDQDQNILSKILKIQRIKKIAKELHKKISNKDTINFKKLIKNSDRFENIQQKIQFKNDIIIHLRDRIQLLGRAYNFKCNISE